MILPRTPSYAWHIYDWVTKYLARDSGAWPGPTGEGARRHDYFGVAGPGETGRYSESWRFPVVEPHFDPLLSPEERKEWNEITFIYAAERDRAVLPKVVVAGLPEPALDALPLERVEDSCYLAATVVLPARRAYRYAFVVDGKVQPDPLSPHRERLNNGEEVSVVVTLGCFEPVVLERWELTLLKRISNHILPFNSREDELFQINPGSGPGKALAPQLHRLDHAVGVANYIDKLLAREERHHLLAYKNCLGQINRILRERNPYLEPRDMPESIYVQLYGEMASGNVPGWNYQAYGSPSYFLFLLRRHVWTGAFAHPKYGGNANTAGWLWLADSFPFDFAATQELPLGRDPDYRG